MLEVADVEGGQSQLDVAKVAVAGIKALCARGALVLFVGDAHERVHGSVGGEDALVGGGGGEVVNIAV